MSQDMWKNAPEWAMWAAMDSDGQWSWYERCPKRISCSGYFVIDKGNWKDFNHEKCDNWKESLTPRPDNFIEDMWPEWKVKEGDKITTQDHIRDVCLEITDMLLSKNAAYGDSAINPVRYFSKCSPIEQINVRIDDKLSRLARGTASGEDVELDLIGYLVLKRVALRKLGINKDSDEFEINMV